jgi:hypothetical protein
MPNRLRGGAVGAPLSYVDTKYNGPSASVGSNVQISEPGLVRPVLNPTGGKRSYRRSHKRRSYRRSHKRRSYSHKQRGSGAMGAPFSYVNSKYSEASASAGSDIQISEPGLVRPVLNPTGGAAAPPIASSASPVLVMPPPAPPPPVCAPAPPVPCTPPPPPSNPPSSPDATAICIRLSLPLFREATFNNWRHAKQKRWFLSFCNGSVCW